MKIDTSLDLREKPSSPTTITPYSEPPPPYDGAIAGPSVSPERIRTTAVYSNPTSRDDVDQRRHGPISSVRLPNPTGIAGVATGQISIRRYMDLKGTYSIRPGSDLDDIPSHKLGKKKVPDAYFSTHRGNVDLNLSTCETTSDIPGKVDINVSSRKGNVQVDFTTISVTTRMHLNVYSRKGHVVVFLPKEFNGAIRLHSRRGKANVLPALGEISRLSNDGIQGTLLLFGAEQPGNNHADYCELSSRSGSVTVGLSGVDHFKLPPGFWNQLGERFGMGKNKHRADEDSDSDSDPYSDSLHLPDRLNTEVEVDLKSM